MNPEAEPYAWDPHLVAWLVLVMAFVSTMAGHRRLARRGPVSTPWTGGQIAAFAGAGFAAVAALTWPLANLAAHWSLTALVTQRLVLTLAVPSMALLGLPYNVLQWLTRPAPVDTVLDWCRRPAIAIAVFTVIAVGSLTTGLVHAQASSPVARGLIDAVMVAAGLVMWLPVIGRVPGILRLKPVGRFAYLVAQAVVPAFLSFIYIFSHHPLYDTFARSHLAIGLRPLNDQQIAGFVSKLTMLFVLMTVGGVVLARAQRLDEEYGDDEPLVWADVERQFERADRRTALPTEPDPTPPDADNGPAAPDS